jgi:hypothetical protein
LINATTTYPLAEGWEYDYQNVTINEVSREEVQKEINDRREEIARESEQRIDGMLEELKKHGINLKKPN